MNLTAGFSCCRECLDDAACDFFTGISGRLRGKIVRHVVYDNGSADDLRYCDTGVIKCRPRITLIGHKRRKVAGMAGVQGIVGIIMISRIGKLIGTIPVLVNVKTEKTTGFFVSVVGEIKDFGFDQCGIKRQTVEFDVPV